MYICVLGKSNISTYYLVDLIYNNANIYEIFCGTMTMLLKNQIVIALQLFHQHLHKSM